MSKFVLTAQLRLQAPTNVRQVVNQIQGQLNSVSVNVDVKGAPAAAKQLKAIEKETKAATSAAQQLGKTFGVSLKRFAAFSIATRAVGLFTSRLSDAVDESIEFQRELIKISQVTGKTVTQLKGVTNEIDRLSTTLGTSSKSLLSVTRILAQAGIQSNDLRVALGALAKTTLAPTFDDITQTAEGAIAVISQFGEGVGALERQLGAINAVAGQFAVESGDLISVVRRTGGVFKSAGGSLEELLALFTSVRATTRESAESIATGLRTVFTRIQRPATIQYLKEFGVELTDLNGKFVGPYEAVRQLSTALQGLEEGDIRFVQIAEQLGGFRQIGKVIPLLQQFNTAEAARQAAIEGGNSLTKDAATAQQALAIQITKVKEEFLAFIRSISNTSTFQLFVKTSLDLASALIDIGEAIRPLIPLLGAFAGIKIARGVGGFLSGIGATLGKNAGGKIHAFATGGLVPGVGNRDTVPAMLSPGEFVIRKSSVNKIGASNLAAMNNNGYADGGVVLDSEGRSKVGQTEGLTFQQALKLLENKEIKRSALTKGFGVEAVNAALGTSAPAKKSDNIKASNYPGGVYTTIPGAIGGFFLNPAQGKDGTTDSRSKREFIIKGQKAVLKKGSGINTYTAGGNELKNNASLLKTVKRSSTKALEAGIEVAVPQFEDLLNIPPIRGSEKRFEAAANRISKDKNAVDTTSGFLFEGIIDAVTGAALAGGSANFDFPKQSIAKAKGRLGLLFGGDLSSLIKADARSSRDQASGIFKKIANDIAAGKTGADEGVIREFARGGRPMGTDTVPAMLTPGEYVINRQAAESIGYGNLNRMNKHGVSGFAKGGPVQYFQTGTGATGVTSVSGEGSFAKFFAFQAAAGLASNKLSELSKTADGADTGLSRVIDSLGSMVNVIGTTILTLNTFGISLSAKNIKQLFSSGSGGLGSVINSKLKDFSQNFTSSLSRTRTVASARAFRTSSRGKSGFANPLFETDDARSQLFSKTGKKITPTSFIGKIGNRLGGVAGRGGLIGRAAGALGGGITGAGAIGGGAIAAAAGPLAALAGIVTVLNTGFNSFFGYQQEYEKALESGTTEEVQRFAVLKQQAGIVQALNAAFTALGGEGDALAKGWQELKAVFGGDSVAKLESQAKVTALVTQYERDRAKNTKDANEAIKDFTNGLGNLDTATNAVAKNFNTARAIQAASVTAASNTRREKSGPSPGLFGAGILTGRNVLTLGGLLGETTGTKDARLEAEAKKLEEDAAKRTEQEFDQLRAALGPLAKSAILAGTKFEEFTKNMDLTDTQLDKLRKDYDIQNKAIQENIKFLKSLSFGLRETDARATASTIALQNAVDSMESGFNSYEKTIRVIEASLTSVGSALDPRDIQQAQDQVVQTLRSFGASDGEVAKVRATLTGFNSAQKEAINALRAVQSTSGLDANPEVLQQEFRTELTKRLAGLPSDVRQQITDSLGGISFNDDDIRSINAGNLESIVSKALDPIGKKAAERILRTTIERQKQEKILISLTKQRISLEREAVQARQRAIDIELEAAKNIQEFGGRVLTFADKVNFANRRVNESLNNAGLSGVGSGSTREIAAVQSTLISRFASLQNRQNNAASRGTGAFAGTRIEEDQRQNLQAAQDELIRFARQRIQLIKDELDIIRKKNALEKSSLESLLSGDITSFFEKQAAVGASSVLRGGGDVSSFSASTLGRAFNDLKDQEIKPQELQRIASSVLGVFGVQDTRSARVLSNNTTQEQRLQREGRELSSVLAQGGRNLASIAEMAVTANNAVIRYAGSQVPGVNNNPVTQTQNAANPPNVPAITNETVNKIDGIFNKFTESVGKLENTNIGVKLDPFNINVNFNGAGFLSALNDTIKTEVIKTVQEQLGKLGFDESGKPKRSSFITGN